MISLLASHLWQSTLFAGAASLLTLAFRGNKAQVRYCLWLAASYKFLVPFALLTGLGSHIQTWTPATVHQIAIAAPQLSYTVDRFSQPLFPQIRLSANAASARALLDLVIPGLWLCGVVYLVLTRLRRWRAIRLLVRASIPANIAAPIEIRSSPGLVEPGVVGLMRPVLLLPQGIAQRLTPAEMNAILAHELCHVRSRDNLLACLHMIVETIFWFYPLVWWIGARLLDERERACDEEVVSRDNQPGIYAEAILKVCKLYVESPLVCVSGVTGSNLKRRIESIMRTRRLAGLSVGKKLALGIAGMLALIVPIVIGALNAVWAQEGPDRETKAGGKIAFEVASVKPDPPGALRHVLLPPVGNRLSTRQASLRLLIQYAYGVNSFQIFGGPDWMNSSGFDIEAKAEGNPSRSQIWLMLRSLLEDRFKLKVHRETRLMPAYALTIAKGGLKLPKAAEGDCIDPAPVQGQRPPAPCGYVTIAFEPAKGLDVEGRQVTMADFISVLSRILQRSIIDKTGFSSKLDVNLRFAYEQDITVGVPNPWPQANSGQPEDPGINPPITGALRQQLGLSLKSFEGPVEVLVVDQAEGPSKN